MILYCAQRSTRTEIHLRSVCKVRRRGGRTRLVPDFRFRPRNPLPCVGPRAHWGGWGMGCRPRRRGVPLRRPVSSTPSSVRRSSALDAELAHFCARPRPARFWFPYAGMPDLVVGPAKSDLREYPHGAFPWLTPTCCRLGDGCGCRHGRHWLRPPRVGRDCKGCTDPESSSDRP